MNSYKKLKVLAVLAVFIFIGIAATKQPVNEEFKNLQVLPKNITADSLDKIMDGFTAGLGVNCGYCQFVIRPKLEKFEKVFKSKLKKH